MRSGYFSNQLQAVAAVVGNVASVEAQVDPFRIGRFQESLDVWLVTDVAVGVRVELHMQPVLLKNPLAQLVQPSVFCFHCSSLSSRLSTGSPVLWCRHTSGITTMCFPPTSLGQCRDVGDLSPYRVP